MKLNMSWCPGPGYKTSEMCAYVGAMKPSKQAQCFLTHTLHAPDTQSAWFLNEPRIYDASPLPHCAGTRTGGASASFRASR